MVTDYCALTKAEKISSSGADTITSVIILEWDGCLHCEWVCYENL